MNPRALTALILGVVLALGFLALLFLHTAPQEVESEPIGDQQVRQASGQEHHGWTPFYHEKTGVWRILDQPAAVLKERKFTSSDRERDAYTLFTVEPGGIVRTVESHGRWKRVEVLDGDSVISTGWIDAHFVSNVERLDEPEQSSSER